MKGFSRLFIRGAFTLLPFGLTAFIVLSFLMWTEDNSRRFFATFGLEGIYFPGLGLGIGVALICFLGFLTTLPFMTKVLQAVELPFKNVPILKSVYSAVKSLSDFFSPGGDHADQQVVVVTLPGTEIEIVGFVTRRHLTEMPPEFSKEDRIAVFLPLSYQVGGLTVFIPRSYVKTTSLRVEEAMRSSIVAWMPHRDK
jgi:uncharacterized membrane protein